MKSVIASIMVFLLFANTYNVCGQSTKNIMSTDIDTASIQAERLSFDDFFSLVLNYLEEDNTEDFIDVEYLEEQLKALYDTPINWNNTNRDELRKMLIISESEIDELLFYAGEYGPVRSIYEIQLVQHLSPPLKLLLPNILTVEDVDTDARWGDKIKYGKHYAAIHSNGIIEPKRGFIENKYLGLPVALSAKYKFSSSDFNAAISMKSDAGEPFVGNKEYRRYGFDTYRFYIEATNIPHFGNILLGAYKAYFGKGLIFGNMNWGSKSQQLLNNAQQKKISGYGGTSGQPTMNGVAYSIANGILSANIFYGISTLDADTSGKVWHSISTSGYHRTENEILKQNNLFLHTLGGNISIEKRRWSIGINGYMATFSLPAVASNNIWNAYDFTGKWQWGISAYYYFKKKKISMNGEFAVVNSSFASNNTLQFLLTSSSTIAFNHRYYSPNYHAFWANSYSSVGGINGEHGAGFAIDLPLYKKLSLELFADGYKTLWATTNHPANEMGFEVRCNLKYLIHSNIYDLSIRYKSKPIWHKEDYTIAQTSKENTGTLLLRARYTIENCTLTSGFQANIAFNEENNIGWLIYQDVTTKFLQSNLLVKARVAIYNAPTWQNRFYLYEQNIPEYYYSPALYGSALRWYLLISYKTPIKLQLSIRISETYYSNQESNGSGWDEINSPHRTEIQGTISYNF